MIVVNEDGTFGALVPGPCVFCGNQVTAEEYAQNGDVCGRCMFPAPEESQAAREQAENDMPLDHPEMRRQRR